MSKRKSTIFVEINGVQYVVTKGNPANGAGNRPTTSAMTNKASGDASKPGLLYCYNVLKKKGYWDYIPSILLFLLHFSAVAGLLFAGAWIFMFLEDPLPIQHPHLPSQQD